METRLLDNAEQSSLFLDANGSAMERRAFPRADMYARLKNEFDRVSARECRSSLFFIESGIFGHRMLVLCWRWKKKEAGTPVMDKAIFFLTAVWKEARNNSIGKRSRLNVRNSRK